MKFLALVWVLVGFAAAMEAAGNGVPSPAPQAFLQEVADRFTSEAGAPKGPISLLVSGPDGAVRALGGGTWYERQKGRWHTMPTGSQRPADRFVFPDAEGHWITAEVAPSSVIQLMPIGQGFLVVTTNRLHRWESGKWTRAPWPAALTIYTLAGPRHAAWLAASPPGLGVPAGRRG